MKRTTALTLAVSGAAISLSSASGAYGPPPATHSGVPGGYTRVLASKTIGPAGGNLTARVGTTTVTLAIPRGALGIPLQFALRAANLQLLRQGIARQHVGGTVMLGVAVSGAKPDGTPVRGRFSAQPIELVLRGQGIGQGDRLLHWNASLSKFTLLAGTLRTDGTNEGLALRFTRGQELAVIRASR